MNTELIRKSRLLRTVLAYLLLLFGLAISVFGYWLWLHHPAAIIAVGIVAAVCLFVWRK